MDAHSRIRRCQGLVWGHVGYCRVLNFGNRLSFWWTGHESGRMFISAVCEELTLPVDDVGGCVLGSPGLVPRDIQRHLLAWLDARMLGDKRKILPLLITNKLALVLYSGCMQEKKGRQRKKGAARHPKVVERWNPVWHQRCNYVIFHRPAGQFPKSESNLFAARGDCTNLYLQNHSHPVQSGL